MYDFWIKFNTDGATRGNPGISTCGGISRDVLGTFLGTLSTKIGVFTSFQDELHGIIFAIKYANKRNWRNNSLETNSMLVIRAFSNENIVSWNLLIQWKNT